jgi:hypothetical protein
MLMEESREPQRPIASSLATPPAYPIQPAPYYAPAPPAKVSRWLRFRRTLRLLFRRLLYGTTVVGRALRPFAGFVALVLVLLGIIGWMSYMLWAPKEAPPVFQRAESLPPSGAIEAFLQGQQNYDAELMWEAYSPDYQAAQLQRGASKAVLQAQAEAQRRRGLQYVHSDYIGGVKLDDGRSMYFYTVDLALDSQHAKFPYIFTADPTGKIVEVDSPFTRSQSTGQ